MPIMSISSRTKIMLQIFFSYSISFIIAIWLFLLFKASNVAIETIAPPNSIWNTVYFFGLIIVETIILIVLLRIFWKINFIKIIDILVCLVCVFSIASFFFEFWFMSLLISFLVVLVKELSGWVWFKNAIVFLVVGFFSAYIGYTLGICPIFLLLVLIAIYDYIAVFKTKHMVFLADKIINKNTLFVMDFHSSFFNKERNKEQITQNVNTEIKQKELDPSKRNHLHLGTGDFALPLIGVMTLFAANWIFGLVSFVVVLFGLELTVYLLFTKKHYALPAIPLQVICFAGVYLIYLLYTLLYT